MFWFIMKLDYILSNAFISLIYISFQKENKYKKKELRLLLNLTLLLTSSGFRVLCLITGIKIIFKDNPLCNANLLKKMGRVTDLPNVQCQKMDIDRQTERFIYIISISTWTSIYLSIP